jgi:hypothetical protein
MGFEGAALMVSLSRKAVTRVDVKASRPLGDGFVLFWRRFGWGGPLRRSWERFDLQELELLGKMLERFRRWMRSWWAC